MIYNISILVEYKDKKPSEEDLDQLTDNLITAIDNYCDNCERSFIIDKTEDNIKQEYKYIYDVEVDANKKIDSKELFNYIAEKSVCPVKLVEVFEKRFNPHQSCNAAYYWTNEGMTTYYDGSTYIDPVYEFHTPEGQHYEVVYIPVYASRFQTRDKEHYDNSGATYMWRCTACWDNCMKATTIEDAIEEFEQIYKQKLWSTVEGCKKSLDEAIDSFAAFDEYLWSKNDDGAY